jgi:hypothetical protein
MRVHRLHLARDWISTRGPQRQRRTTLIFVLGRPAVVEFVVLQLAPDCRRLARFRIHGHGGVNRIRVGRRIGRRTLAPGTYRFVARTLPSGRRVADTQLVVVQDASRTAIRAARHADTCARAAISTNRSTRSTIDQAHAAPAGAEGPTNDAGPTKDARPTRDRGVRGAKFAKGAFSAADDAPVEVYVLLGLAIALLGAAAALPKATRTRPSAPLIAGLSGAGILLGVTIAYALS